jgi:hypothetical protein
VSNTKQCCVPRSRRRRDCFRFASVSPDTSAVRFFAPRRATTAHEFSLLDIFVFGELILQIQKF